MNKIVAVLFTMIFLTACKSDDADIQMKPINNAWKAKAEQKFQLNIDDAQNVKNIIFVVRNNNDYPYSNIRFIVNLTDLKTKKKQTDTLNYILARPNGEWLGTGFGNTKEILFQYKTNYKFPANGNYEIGMIQAMRKDTLIGIEDIGIKIQNIKP
ncbi:gliding motility lipoprotein GldH [Frigoriflavimonas asaccharolytica]|uniref:Gliding motility-associated lipoprotein GldH n=1 Tax=Frigoriflavimonas asaccharolytica TaxID=2735899 RepID=A0A8J8G6R0_9FLAO|nr:gliding motility lipoprotein GldH [Frigoriflavimonas asaccharolytica]NRS91002.1 gliding motility-associated lipoprotein GldH [Frigoriflavimonas asaccharolytica]